MTPSDFRYGFRIVGKTCEPRWLVDAGAAFAAHCAADARCEPDQECYLSAFWFAADFTTHLRATLDRRIPQAVLVAVTIDTGVYDKTRAFRAPNSRHSKTGLHKRRLTLDELLGPLDAILELATTPAACDVPTVSTTSDHAAAPSAESTSQDAAASSGGTADDSQDQKPPEAATGDSGVSEGCSCQQVTPVTDLQSAVAKLWQDAPAALPAAPVTRDVQLGTTPL